MWCYTFGMGIWKPIGGRSEDGEWVGHDPSTAFPVYTRGNAGEVYPEVFTPMSFSFAAEAGEKAMRASFLSTGLIRPDELDQIPIGTAVGSGVFGGYAYLNLSIQRLGSARVPGGKATDADINFLGVGEPPPHVPLPTERNLRASLAGALYLWRTLKIKDLPELRADQRLVDDHLARLHEPSTATDIQLRESVDQLLPLITDLFERHLKVSFSAGFVVAVLAGICERQLDDPLLAPRLLGGLGDVDSAAPSQAMWDLSRMITESPSVGAAFDLGMDGLLDRLEANVDAAPFLERFGEFLARFGSRGPNEWDTAFDTWETDPALALTLIDRMRGADDSHNPSLQQKRLAEEAATLEAECIAKLRPPVRGLFNRALRAARVLSRSRERSKTTVVRAIHGSRLQVMELDRRLTERSGGQRGDLWLVVKDELDDYIDDPASFAETIAARRLVHARLDEREPPFFFDGSQPPLSEWALKSATLPALGVGEVLTGQPGCPGIARGRARVVTSPGDPRGLEPGEVLIAPVTDPAWTPLFVPADAVVVDVGALMSHAVIVSRELGIPCVVSATNATKQIPDGAVIEVDGSKGTVTIISVPENDPGEDADREEG